MTPTAKFAIGSLVQHNKFNYRGVVVDVDPQFMLSEQWYEQVAKSRPPKDQPWYRVLVDNADNETYVAERHLEADSSQEPIRHPLVDELFSGFSDGHYQTGQRQN
ncbi:MAG: heat shock protein HspQ [Pseudomonadales bacterium]|nr:heat shock protein HspQ [Pseudomonadales bacterium]